MTVDVEITDNAFLRQFEFHLEAQFARIEYSLQDRKIFLTKFEMPDEMQEKGLLDPFIETVCEEIRNRHISMVPTCSEISSFIRRNRRKYKDLLPVGINI
ncbi:MAG: N-acetyltransferase [Flavobacteriaceae bacterium CG_4_8_14_3_um_filter_34_10]|nr:N-acetyltransferase [Flavobacteriia bacterium]OIP51655.1 MAG: N-acetyltransferase [Flavobacteriaceae bacterium CG2_30_34_30]PIQ17248.1 MAG: N-acetyltransferase [Flavobacteriaceae bacterium CG18_big_fil_WC_8_21_14_2_50_34_36]PIV48600.1 MAG: N-acetyltransferase [Flavobacteriaceae bacterium CG02_land_8_20_14_3_00_34_13]PIX10100.1 MAG: N-acetyltransferase [Flavobacteriaceae bacterium CG_4_8_14_3_um_filter_34_10]PIZ07044.1 MAG: N-acetyltransferase [Flavobacteriaceae bacterium CG_4_10_14_0_8_um_f